MNLYEAITTKRLFKFARLLCIISTCLGLSSCHSKVDQVGIVESQFQPCPSSPNCVSSDSVDAQSAISPLVFSIPPEKAWLLLKNQLAEMPDAKIVEETPGYLHLECRSKVFGFVDDLEFHLRPDNGVIAVRSASRTGYYDFNVNRKRIEALRKALSGKGFI